MERAKIQKTIYLSLAVLIFLLPISLDKFFPAIGSNLLFFLYGLAFMVVLIVTFLASLISIILIGVKLLRRQQLRLWYFVFPVILFVMAMNLLILGLFPTRLPTGSDLVKFDSVKWLAKQEIEESTGMCVRQKMLKDLVVNILPGKSREEIESLLGKSIDSYNAKSNELNYYLGPERDSFIGIDSESLLIKLDKDGKFEKYEVHTD